ncbi:hypothetical protein EHYA_05530 [Embleya hyalina]|uniref:Uncharacterized protein n=1 Tax=Embleya hyalina TaxID=516124 RepID=A0A401YT93_9ACTN|nr:hypothetical protein EHYA_05530 [Embleya hyalina]
MLSLCQELARESEERREGSTSARDMSGWIPCRREMANEGGPVEIMPC